MPHSAGKVLVHGRTNVMKTRTLSLSVHVSANAMSVYVLLIGVSWYSGEMTNSNYFIDDKKCNSKNYFHVNMFSYNRVLSG